MNQGKVGVLQERPAIIIAAYNEASVIRNLLCQLQLGQSRNEYQVTVVCNGCTDDTEKIVRDEFPHVQCCSLSEPSKALAIRHAESLGLGFPRLYLDADIELNAECVQELFSYAQQFDSAALIIPSSTVLDANSSSLVKSFYRHWYKTPYVQQSGYGAGAYLINERGRQRFDLWPDLIADDAFVRSQFAQNEIHISSAIRVLVKAPRTVWSLLKIKTRSKLGNLELRSFLNKTRTQNDHGRRKIDQKAMQNQSTAVQWYDPIVYMFVNVIAACSARWLFNRGTNKWHRDETNR